MISRSWGPLLAGAVAAAAGVLAAVAMAAGPVLTSPVQTINEGHETGSGQGQPRVAMGADGRWAASYLSIPPSGNDDDIFLRRYSGADVASAVQEVRPGTDDRQSHDIAMSPSGAMVVAYLGRPAGAPSFVIKAQRFGAGGDPEGAEIAVSTATDDAPRVAMAPDGRFVVTWLVGRSQVRARFFDAGGAPLTGELTLGTVPNSFSVLRPSVAVNASGNAIVTWVSEFGTASTPTRIAARRYDRDGAPAGAQFDAYVSENGQGAVDQDVALAGDGSAVLVFFGRRNLPAPARASVLIQRVSAANVPAADVILASEGFRVDDFTPAVAADAAGNFAVTWLRQTNIDTIYAREFDAAGVPRAGESVVGTASQGTALNPDIAMSAGQAPVVAWNGFGGPRARRLTSGSTPPVTTTPSTTTTTTPPAATTAPADPAPTPTTPPSDPAPPADPPVPPPALPARPADVTTGNPLRIPPKLARCGDKRKFTFTLHHPAATKIVQVQVSINGKRTVTKRGANVEKLTLTRLPQKRFTVRIQALQDSGSSLVSVRTYAGCKKSRAKTRRGARR